MHYAVTCISELDISNQSPIRSSEAATLSSKGFDATAFLSGRDMIKGSVAKMFKLGSDVPDEKSDHVDPLM